MNTLGNWLMWRYIVVGAPEKLFILLLIYLFIYLKSTWQRAGSATYIPHSSKNMHIKVIHTNKTQL